MDDSPAVADSLPKHMKLQAANDLLVEETPEDGAFSPESLQRYGFEALVSEIRRTVRQEVENELDGQGRPAFAAPEPGAPPAPAPVSEPTPVPAPRWSPLPRRIGLPLLPPLLPPLLRLRTIGLPPEKRQPGKTGSPLWRERRKTVWTPCLVSSSRPFLPPRKSFKQSRSLFLNPSPPPSRSRSCPLFGSLTLRRNRRPHWKRRQRRNPSPLFSRSPWSSSWQCKVRGAVPRNGKTFLPGVKGMEKFAVFEWIFSPRSYHR